MVDLEALHKKSTFNKAALAQSPLCGCFWCLRIFPPSEIVEWVRSDASATERANGTCALCPYCATDAILPSIEVELTPELLAAMKARWFTVTQPT